MVAEQMVIALGQLYPGSQITLGHALFKHILFSELKLASFMQATKS